MKIVLKDGQMDRSQTTGDLKSQLLLTSLFALNFAIGKFR